MTQFYDTNALLFNFNKDIQFFLISSLTLTQLESIKQNSKKDPEVRYKTRHLINWLAKNTNKYQIIDYRKEWDQELKNYPTLLDNTDSRIILTAIKVKDKLTSDLLFITYDISCMNLAKKNGLNVFYSVVEEDTYTGYKQIYYKNEEELIDFYSSFNNKQSNYYDLLPNEYIIIKDKNDNIIDFRKFLGIGKGYSEIKNIPFNSQIFGKTKAKDIYQQIAIDSLNSNQISVIRGPAGTGKSLLSLAYLFEKLEKGKIDKIIIFCNTVATQGSAKLGYYPGSKNQKLLDSQIGNFLASKLGDKFAVQMLIDKEQLLLLPMSDIRGFDTTGMKAGIYITQAQNMSVDLMKLALQRIGEDSIVILDGDSQAQVDLGAYAGNNNGLKRVSSIFRGESIYGQVTLKTIYRSKIANIAQRM